MIGLLKEIKNLPHSIKLLSFLMFVYNLGWGIVIPFLPLYYKEILKTYTATGIIIGLLPLLKIFWDFPIGLSLDRVSKRTALRYVLILYFPLSYILLSLRTLFGFIYFRIYHSFLASFLWLSSQTYLRANSPKEKETISFAFFDSLSNFSLILGPFLGACLIYKYGFSILWAISFFAFLSFLISFFLPKEKKVSPKPAFFYNKKFLKVCFFLFLFILASSSLGMLLPLFLNYLGASYFQIGLFYGFFSFPSLFEFYFGNLKEKKKLIRLALISGAFLFSLMYFFKNVYLLSLIVFLLSFCITAIIPHLQGRLTTLMPFEKIGSFSAVANIFIHLGGFIGPFLAGVISDFFGLRYVLLEVV